MFHSWHDVAFPVAENPMGLAAGHGAQGVHEDIIHFAPSQGIAVLEVFYSRREKQGRSHGEKGRKSPVPQYKGQSQPQRDEEEHIHQHGTVQFRLNFRLPEALKRNKYRLTGALPSCVDGHVKNHRHHSNKEKAIGNSPPEAILLPEAQAAPKEDQQKDPEEDTLEGLAVDE